MAATFESSTWVGGIVLPLAAVPIALVMLVRAEPRERLRIFIHFAVAGLIALLLISPFLYDQLRMTALRGDGSPIAIVPFEILGDNVRDFIGDRLGGFSASAANAAAYWAILLPVEFPAFYLAGMVALFYFLKDRAMPREVKSIIIAFALALAASLCRRLAVAEHARREQRSRLARGAAGRAAADGFCRRRTVAFIAEIAACHVGRRQLH